MYKAKESKTLKQAFKTPAFWLFIGAALPLYFGFNVNVSAGVLHFSGMGIDPGIVAFGLSVQGIVALIVRFLIAPLIDRVEPVRVLAFAGVVMAVSMFIASFCGPDDTALMFVYFVCIGCGWGINLVCGPPASPTTSATRLLEDHRLGAAHLQHHRRHDPRDRRRRVQRHGQLQHGLHRHRRVLRDRRGVLASGAVSQERLRALPHGGASSGPPPEQEGG